MPESNSAAVLSPNATGPVTSNSKTKSTKLQIAGPVWPLAALGLLLLFNLFFTAGFFDVTIKDGHLYGVPIDVLNRGSQVMLLALGMTLVIASGGVDLSVGAIMAISGAVAAQMVQSPYGFVAAICIALLCAIVAGVWNGALVGVVGLQPIVATLILMVAGRGVAQLITGGQIITFTDERLSFLGNGHLLGLPFPVVMALGMFGLTALLTRKTALGLFVESVGDNETASRYVGLNSGRIKMLTYVFSGFCAGLAGLSAAANIRGADANNAGLFLELDAILAVVIGGTALTGGRFSLVGSMIGALFIQTLTTTMYMRNVSAEVAPLPKAIVIIAVCLLQSEAFRQMLAKRFARKKRMNIASLKRWFTPRYMPTISTALVLAALYIGGCIAYPNFGSPGVLINLLGDNAFLGVAAIGATFVILSGGIDLSVGAMVAFSSILVATLVEKSGVPPLVAITIALAIGSLFGAAMGSLIQFFRLPAFLVTLGGMFFARGLAFVVAPQSLAIKNEFYTTTVTEKLAIPLGGNLSLSFPALCCILFFAVAYGVIHYTRFGRGIYAVGGDEESARLMGLPIVRTRILIYTVSGFCSAAAGVIYSMYTQSGDPATAVGFELDAIAAVVIGGTLLNGGVGYIFGTAMGVLILGLIQTLITFQGTLNTWWTRIAVGLLVLAFLVLQKVVSNLSRKVKTPASA